MKIKQQNINHWIGLPSSSHIVPSWTWLGNLSLPHQLSSLLNHACVRGAERRSAIYVWVVASLSKKERENDNEEHAKDIYVYYLSSMYFNISSSSFLFALSTVHYSSQLQLNFRQPWLAKICFPEIQFLSTHEPEGSGSEGEGKGNYLRFWLSD